MRNMKKFTPKMWRWGMFLLVIVVVFSMSVSQGSAEVNWTKYKGTELVVLSWTRPIVEVARSQIPEFEAKTGMKVTWTIMGAWDLRAKVARELAAGMPSFDIWGYHPHQQQAWLSRGGYVVDQIKYIQDPKLTSAEWDFDDFLSVGKKSNRLIDPNAPFCIAPGSSTRGVAYRKDLFEKYGLTPPQTFEELEEAAKKLTLDTNGDGEIDIYGYVSRGMGMQAVPNVSAFLFGYGGAWWTNDGKSALDKLETIRAIKEYARMLRTYGPPSPGELGWLEKARFFAMGKAATVLGSLEHMYTWEDPEKSEVAGSVGYLLYPSGPAGRYALTETWVLATPKAAKNPEAAWLFIQWITNKENQFRCLLNGTAVTRRSAWDNPAYKPKSEEWAEVTKEALEIGRDWVMMSCIPFQKVREMWGKVISTAIAGESIEELAHKTAEEINALLLEVGDNPASYLDPNQLYMPKNVYRMQ